MPVWLWILLGLLAAIAVVAFVRSLVGRVTVLEFERGLKYSRGRFAGVLGPGQYRIYRRTTRVSKVDVRPRFVTIPGQELLSADGVTLRVSIAAEYAIEDPAVAVNEAEDFTASLYLTLQLALRDVVGSAPIDDVLEQRPRFGERLLADAAERAAALGLRLQRVEVKDIMFPGDLKRTFAQVVNARKEGLAALERARGETAALRNLANAARMVADNPALMQLRLIQEIGGSAGNTIVLGLPNSTTPLPLRERQPPIDQIPPPDRPPDET